jgi:hypothetical protein
MLAFLTLFQARISLVDTELLSFTFPPLFHSTMAGISLVDMELVMYLSSTLSTTIR